MNWKLVKRTWCPKPNNLRWFPGNFLSQTMGYTRGRFFSISVLILVMVRYSKCFFIMASMGEVIFTAVHCVIAWKWFCNKMHNKAMWCKEWLFKRSVFSHKELITKLQVFQKISTKTWGCSSVVCYQFDHWKKILLWGKPFPPPQDSFQLIFWANEKGFEDLDNFATCRW